MTFIDWLWYTEIGGFVNVTIGVFVAFLLGLGLCAIIAPEVYEMPWYMFIILYGVTYLWGLSIAPPENRLSEFHKRRQKLTRQGIQTPKYNK